VADPKIRIKRSAVAGRIPSVDQVPLGELALNTWDGQLYASKNVGLGTTVVAVNPWLVGTGTDSYNAYFTAGNIGIGSTTPTSALYVVGDTNIDRHLNVSGVITATSFSGDGSSLTGIQAGYFEQNQTGIHTIGNVGIGTTTADGAADPNNTTVLNAGIVTAVRYYGDGSFLTGVGAAITVQDSGSNQGSPVILNFGSGLSVTSTSGGISTITATAGSGSAGISRNITDFTATAGQTDFTVSYTAGRIEVFLNGVRLRDTTDYTATNESSVVLTSAAAAGDELSVVEYLVNTSSTGITGKTTTSFTATAGQTTFTVAYVVGAIDVFRNGIRLVDGDDYAATDGISVVLVSAASDGDSVVVVESQGLFGVNQTGINTTSNLGIGTTSAYNALTVVGDANISGVLTATTLYGNGANLTGIQAGFFVQNQTGIHTTSNIGVGTTSAFDALSVIGDANISGVVTATAFYGDGSNLQGVVSGVGVALSTYNVGYAQTTIEFIGSGVTVVSIGDTTQVTIEPGLVGAAKSVTSFTATAGQTAFNVDHSAGQENVFLNGVRLSESQYTTNGSTITLNDPASDGDSVDIVVYLRGSDPNRNIEVNLRPPFNGVTTAFTMYRGTSDTLFSPVDERQILVSLGGVIQQPGIAYTVGAGSSLYFSAAPGAGVTCFITGLFSTQSGIATDATKIETDVYNPTGVQTSFTVTRGYEQNYLEVYLNGAKLISGQDFTATDSSTFDLTSPAQNGDVVEAVAYRTIGITSAVTAGISSNVNGDYVNTTNLTVAGVSTFSDKIGIGTESGGINRFLAVNNSDDDCFISVRSNISKDSAILFGDNDSDAKGQVKYDNNLDELAFWTSGSERVRIFSSGVGIGTTVAFYESFGNPARMSVGLGTTGTFESLNVVGGSSVLNLSDVKGGANLILQNADATNENYTMVRGRNQNGSTTSAIAFINMGHTGSDEGHMVFATRNTSGIVNEALRITGIGSVGIGTTRPIADLHVDGQLFIGDRWQNSDPGSNAPGSPSEYKEAQVTIGGQHNTGFNLQNKYKLLISGSDNDLSTENAVRQYPLYIEDENGHPLFNVGINEVYKETVGIGTTIGRAGLTIHRPVGLLGPDECNLRLIDEADTQTQGSGGSIVFSYTYIDNNRSGLNAGPFIKGYKTNDTSGDYGGGLSFGTRINGGSQVERMRIQENGNIMVGVTTNNAQEKIHISFDSSNNATLLSTGNSNTNAGLKVENFDQTVGSYSGIHLRTGVSDVKLICENAGSNAGDFAVVQDISGGSAVTLRYDISEEELDIRGGKVRLLAEDQTSPNATAKIWIPNRGTSDRLEIQNPANNGVLVRIYDTGQVDMPEVYADAVTGRDVYVTSSGQLGYLSSSGIAKTNVETLDDVSWIYNLRPVSFNYRKKVEETKFEFTDEYYDNLEYGLIAEDVEKIAPELCFYDEVEQVGIGSTVVGISTELRGVEYRKLFAPMLKALQDANARIEALEAQVSALQGS
jgi:hypothetical protein